MLSDWPLADSHSHRQLAVGPRANHKAVGTLKRLFLPRGYITAEELLSKNQNSLTSPYDMYCVPAQLHRYHEAAAGLSQTASAICLQRKPFKTSELLSWRRGRGDIAYLSILDDRLTKIYT